jgi:hypothetical protein
MSPIGKKEEGKGKREEGRRKREEGRGKREEGRRKREEGLSYPWDREESRDREEYLCSQLFNHG